MPHDIAFKVGDQLRCINKMSGNGIVVARSAKDGAITYTIFTDFGNIIERVGEIEMLNQFEVIEQDPSVEELYGDDNHANVRRWLQDRSELISKQTYEYYSQIRRSTADDLTVGVMSLDKMCIPE